MESRSAKVISIAQGRRDTGKPTVSSSRAEGAAHKSSQRDVPSLAHPLLSILHPSVLAILVAREGQGQAERSWEIFERDPAEDSRQRVLSRITLPDLLLILKKSADSVAEAVLSEKPHILNPPHPRGGWSASQTERLTVSPWPDFDLALLLRDGEPRYATCLDPGASIYIAEASVQEVARYFDALRARRGSRDKGEL